MTTYVDVFVHAAESEDEAIKKADTAFAELSTTKAANIMYDNGERTKTQVFPEVIDNEWVKDHLEEVFGGIEDFNHRYEFALCRMDRYRCPLSHADQKLYEEMYDALSDWCEDNELDIDDFDIEEIIF